MNIYFLKCVFTIYFSNNICQPCKDNDVIVLYNLFTKINNNIKEIMQYKKLNNLDGLLGKYNNNFKNTI